MFVHVFLVWLITAFLAAALIQPHKGKDQLMYGGLSGSAPSNLSLERVESLSQFPSAF
jgi:hypothetical protein